MSKESSKTLKYYIFLMKHEFFQLFLVSVVVIIIQCLKKRIYWDIKNFGFN